LILNAARFKTLSLSLFKTERRGEIGRV